MKPKIQVLNGVDRDICVVIEGPSLLIGRRSHCDLCLKDPTVSREHAKLVHQAEGWVLERVSSKGVLKCDGERVERCVLSGRHKIQCGGVLLGLNLLGEEFARPKRGLKSSQEGLRKEGEAQHNKAASRGPELEKAFEDEITRPVLEQGITGLERSEGLEDERGEPTMEAARSFSPKWVIRFGLLLLMAFLAWRLLRNIDAPPVPLVTLTYRAGEEKLIDLEGYLRRFEITRLPEEVRIDHNGMIMARMEPPPLTILWFKTLKQGRATLTLMDDVMGDLLQMNFIIKGEVDPLSQRVAREQLGDDELLQRAREMMGRAKLVAKDSPYESYHYYSDALKDIGLVSMSHPLYFKCREEMREPQRIYQERLDKLWEESARLRKNKLYAEALKLVEEILSMVKDPSSLDHQRAQIHKKHLLKRVES